MCHAVSQTFRPEVPNEAQIAAAEVLTQATHIAYFEYVELCVEHEGVAGFLTVSVFSIIVLKIMTFIFAP